MVLVPIGLLNPPSLLTKTYNNWTHIVLQYSQRISSFAMSCCSHEAHQHEDPERGREFSLYTKIDFQTLDCLNEAVEGSGAGVFKPWDMRKDKSKVFILSKTKNLFCATVLTSFVHFSNLSKISLNIKVDCRISGFWHSFYSSLHAFSLWRVMLTKSCFSISPLPAVSS